MSERYKLKSLFARGGMAEVYLGVSMGAEGFEKSVAIKRILPHLAADERIAKMFTAEAKLASHLQHQNIVQTFDVGQGPDGLYIVMELVNGWDLGQLIEGAAKKNVPFPPALAAFVALQALAGLSHAYRKQIQGKRLITAHRDISPSNILVSVEGEVKVADFGIARMEALGGGGTEPGTFKGKVAYASPEMLRGESATAHSDQFSLGIVMHEMLTGLHPFGVTDNLVGYIEKLQKDSLFPLPGVPTELANIVRRALSKDVANRFETPDAFGRALSQYLSRAGEAANAQELSDFIQTLQPPQPLAERAETTVDDIGHGDTVVRQAFALKSAPAASMNYMQEVFDPDWKPTGAVMDIDGKLEGGRNSPAAAMNAPRRGPPVVAEEKLELMERAPKPVAKKKKHDDDSPLSVPDLPAFRETRAARAGGIGKWVFLASLLFVAGGALYFYPAFASKKTNDLSKALAAKLPTARTAVLQVNSVPEGAEVTINGTTLGTTPLITENIYPRSEVNVVVNMTGFKTWTGKFRGGEDSTVAATLTRK